MPKSDYRRIPRALSHVYYHPLSTENTIEINKLFRAMTGDAAIVKDRQLTIWGRSLAIPESTNKVAKFTFTELCGHALSAADYIEVTRAFHTIFLLDVPKMDLNHKDMVRGGLRNVSFDVDFLAGASVYYVH